MFSRSKHVQPNYFKPCNSVLVSALYSLRIQFYRISIFKVKNSVFDPKRLSLFVRNIFNQISLKYAIMFLLLPFILLLIKFCPISIFKVKKVFLHQKLRSLSVRNMFNQISLKLTIMFVNYSRSGCLRLSLFLYFYLSYFITPQL